MIMINQVLQHNYSVSNYIIPMKCQFILIFSLFSLTFCGAFESKDAKLSIESPPTCLCDKCSTGQAPSAPWGTLGKPIFNSLDICTLWSIRLLRIKLGYPKLATF